MVGGCGEWRGAMGVLEVSGGASVAFGMRPRVYN